MQTRILAVDDDPNIREVIGYALEKADYLVHYAVDGNEALRKAAQSSFELIVLDIGLPERDGLEVCQEIRKTSDTPILFLTARDDEIDRILGLELGGDDYVTKPFSPRELVARIKAILKRTSPRQADAAPSQTLRHGDLSLDSERHSCRFAGQDVALTSSEFSLLAHLLSRPQIVVSRQGLIDAVYGHNIHLSDRTVDSHIRNIRKKLSAVGCGISIETVHGVGFRMGPCQ